MISSTTAPKVASRWRRNRRNVSAHSDRLAGRMRSGSSATSVPEPTPSAISDS